VYIAPQQNPRTTCPIPRISTGGIPRNAPSLKPGIPLEAVSHEAACADIACSCVINVI